MVKRSSKKVVQLPKQVVGNIGLFYTCYELSRRGLNVVPTSRNTRGVDLLVGSEDFSHQVSVQIKTSKKRMYTSIGTKEDLPGRMDARKKFQVARFWVFVLLNEDGYSVDQTAVCDSSDHTLFFGRSIDVLVGFSMVSFPINYPENREKVGPAER